MHQHIRGTKKQLFTFTNLSILMLAVSLLAYCDSPPKGDLAAGENWPEYNGGPGRNHYSSLTEITPKNLSRLEKVWQYSSEGADTVKNQTQIQCNPLIIDGILYGVSAGSQAFALDATSGREIWKTSFRDETFSMTSRGLTYYSHAQEKKIFFGYGHWLYALDASSGKPIPTFGEQGKINLKNGLSRPGADDYVVYNTPGVIFEDLLITGIRVSESSTALPGDYIPENWYGLSRPFPVKANSAVIPGRRIPVNTMAVLIPGWAWP